MVKFSFTHFDVEAYGSYVYDSVEPRNGLNENSPLIGRFCGNTKPSTQYAYSGAIRVTFKSDGSATRAGFRATFAAELTGKINKRLQLNYNCRFISN